MIARRTVGSRTRAFVLFLLHLVLVGASPLADARLEGEAASAQHAVELHAEDEDCGTHHDHAACAVCRALGSAAASLSPSPVRVADIPHVVGDPVLPSAPRAGTVQATARSSRAPPSA